MKFTCPLRFNDPFDCFPYYDERSIDDLPKNRKDLLRSASKHRKLSPAQHILEKGKTIARLKKHVQGNEFASSILESIGVVSLSRDPQNILMWSHYAGFHKGFVVEFKIPTKLPVSERSRIDRWLFPLPVKYSDQRPVFKYGSDDHNETMEKVPLKLVGAFFLCGKRMRTPKKRVRTPS